MPLYHCNQKPVQRSKGKNAVHSAAYFRGAKMYDQRTGTTTDYRYKSEAVYSKLFATDDAPEWVQQLIKAEQFGKGEDKHTASEILWNKSEQHNNRKNSQLANRWNVALQKELTVEQNIEAIEKVSKMLARDGTVVDTSIHWGSKNPHGHILETQNFLTEDGFGLKNRALNTKARLNRVREEVANIMNHTLEKYGHDVRVDHRSYADRGIDLVPTIHRGASDHMEKRGIETRKKLETEEIKEENYQRIVKEPELILTKLSQERTNFTINDVANEVIKHVPVSEILAKNDPSNDSRSEIDLDKVMNKVLEQNAVFDERAIAKELDLEDIKSEKFLQVLETIKGSEKIMYLGVGDDGRDRYTTKEFFQRESNMQDQIDVLALRMSHFVNKATQTRSILECEKKQGFKFSEEQKTAINHLLSTGDAACLTGKAGTGKTTVLTPCVTAWKNSGHNTLGLATALVAANALDECGFDDTRSISSLFFMIDEHGYNPINSKSVVAVDEASMVSSEYMARLVNICEKVGAKIVPLGDEMQLPGVAGGAPFKAIVSRIGSALLSNVIRQKEQWMRDASFEFGVGNTKAGLQAYQDKGKIHFSKSDNAAKQSLIKDWSKDLTPLNQKIIMCHEREDVKSFKRSARKSLVDSGVLAQSHSLRMSKYANNKSYAVNLDVAVNERLIIESRGKAPKQMLANNQFGTITDIKLNEKNNIKSISILLDGKHKELTLTAKTIREKHIVLQYGYAATIHQLQGANKKTVFAYFSRMCDRALAYVMMTRHKGDCNAYASHEQFKDFADLALRAGKAPIKDSVIDFAYNFALRRGFEAEQLTGIKRVFADKIINATTQVKDFFERTINPEKYAAKIENQTRLEKQAIVNEQNQRATEIKRENAKIVAQYRDLNQASGRAWAEVSKQAKELGHWNYLDKKPELQHMADTPIYKEATVITNNANKSAAMITADMDSYRDILKDAGISEDILRDKEQKFALTKAIEGYQQDNQEKLVFAYTIIHALDNDLRLYPQIKDANLDLKQLTIEAREHQRQVYHQELKGKELDGFIRVETYNQKSTKAAELYKIYAPLVEQDRAAKIKHLDDVLGVSRKNGVPNDTVGYNYLEHIARQKIEPIYEKYNITRAEANKLAYELQGAIKQDEASHAVGLKFFQFENSEVIEKLNQSLDSISQDIKAEEKISSIGRQKSFMESKQLQIDKHANDHKISTNMQEYKETKSNESASIIREAMKDSHGKIYYLAKEHDVNWNGLLTKGEQFDRIKLNETLTPEQRACFDRVEQYIQLTRVDGSKLSFDENMERKHTMTKLAHEIINGIKTHEQALGFYHIAVDKEQEDAPKYQLNNLQFLEKNAAIYANAIKLVDIYKNEQDTDKKRELAYELTKAPFYSAQAVLLIESLDTYAEETRMIETGKYSILIDETKQAYKEYNKLDKIYQKNENKNKPSDRVGKFNPIDEVLKNELFNLNRDKLIQTTLYDNQADSINNLMRNFIESEPKPKFINKSDNHLQGLMTHLGLPAYEIKVSKEQVESAKEVWQDIQGTRNEAAYGLREKEDKTGVNELSNIFYRLDNKERIVELEAQKQGLTDKKQINSINNRIDKLIEREGYQENHAKIHDCHLHMLQYSKKETPQNASIVRGMFKDDLYGVCFGMAKARGVEWNKLLTEAEKHDRSKLTLTPEQIKSFDQVAEYLELDRKDFDKKQSYMDKANNICKKSIIGKDILNNIEKYKEALQFYQIAHSDDKDIGFLRHETKAFNKLNKTVDNYNAFESLVEQYKAANSEKDIDAITEKLNAKSLQFIKAGYKDNEGKNLTEIKLDRADRNNVPGVETVREYMEAVNGSRAYWRFLKSGVLDAETNKDFKELSIKMNKKRNKLGHAIYSNIEQYQKVLEIANIKQEYLEKHALSHGVPASRVDENTISDYKYNRIMHINKLDERFSLEGLDDWSMELRGFIKEGKKLSHLSDDVKERLERDIKGIKKLDGLTDQWFDKATKPINRPNNKGASEEERIGWAKERANKAAALTEDTPASQYLRGRNIDINLCSLSDDVMAGDVWNSELKKEIPAAVFVARNEEREVRAVQIIYLQKNENGNWQKAPKKKKVKNTEQNRNNCNKQNIEEVKKFLGATQDSSSLEVVKKTLGVMKGASCLIQQGTGDRIALCEGPETACSVAQANPELTVYSLFGDEHFKNFQLPHKGSDNDIIICADNDGVNAESNKIVKKAAEALSYRGSNIYLALPDKIDGQKKTDFNDISSEKIRKCIDQAVLVNEAVTKEKVIATFKGEDTKPEIREATGDKSIVSGLSVEDIHQVAFLRAKKENPEWQHEYFTTYQANRITQDVEFVRNQYNREPSLDEFNEIVARAAFEATALEEHMGILIKEDGELKDDEMWSKLSEARDAAIMSGHRFTVLRDESPETKEFENLELTQYFMQESFTKLENLSMSQEPDNKESDLIEYHTNRFVQRYGEEPNAQNQREIEKIAEAHEDTLLHNPNSDLGYMACVHAEIPTTEQPKGTTEMDLAPSAMADLFDAEKERAEGFPREHLYDIRNSMDVDSIINYSLAQDAKEHEQESQVEKTKTRELEM